MLQQLQQAPAGAAYCRHMRLLPHLITHVVLLISWVQCQGSPAIVALVDILFQGLVNYMCHELAVLHHTWNEDCMASSCCKPLLYVTVTALCLIPCLSTVCAAYAGDCGCPPTHEPVCVDGITFANACAAACGRRRAATAYSGPCVEQAAVSNRPASNAAGGLGSSRWRGSWSLALLVLLVQLLIWQLLP
jgi:hypothetical protein